MFDHALEMVVLAIEIIGIGAIVVGAVISLVLYAGDVMARRPH